MISTELYRYRGEVSGYYQTLLTLNFAVFVVAAVGIGAAGFRGSRPARAFLGLSLVNIGVCIIGAVLLASDHDLVPGIDLQTDYVLGSPVFGLLVGVLTVANGAVAVRAVRHALSSAPPAR